MTERVPHVDESSIAFQEMGRQPDCQTCGDYSCYANRSRFRTVFSPDGNRYIGLSFDDVPTCRNEFRAGNKPNIPDEEPVLDKDTTLALDILSLPAGRLPLRIELDRAYRNAVMPVEGDFDPSTYHQKTWAKRVLTLRLNQQAK